MKWLDSFYNTDWFVKYIDPILHDSIKNCYKGHSTSPFSAYPDRNNHKHYTFKQSLLIYLFQVITTECCWILIRCDKVESGIIEMHSKAGGVIGFSRSDADTLSHVFLGNTHTDGNCGEHTIFTCSRNNVNAWREAAVNINLTF